MEIAKQTERRRYPVSGGDAGGGWVRMLGKVFELGEYPELGFAIDADEMDAAIERFEPVDNDLEHAGVKDVLGFSLGQLTQLYRSGDEVFGEVWVPAWLAGLAGDRLMVSLAFDEAKNVVGNALTVSPRVDDAVVSAKFSKSVGALKRWFGGVAQVAEPVSLERKFPKLEAIQPPEPPGAVGAKFNQTALLGEALPGVGARFVDEAGEMDDRSKRLMAQTELGRATLRKREKNEKSN